VSSCALHDASKQNLAEKVEDAGNQGNKHDADGGRIVPVFARLLPHPRVSVTLYIMPYFGQGNTF
jgi:hypothetical protein